MLYMIQIWCLSPQCSCARICSKLKAKCVYLLLIRQAKLLNTLAASGLWSPGGRELSLVEVSECRWRGEVTGGGEQSQVEGSNHR